MNRRSFIGSLAAFIGGIAIKEAIPLGRVWSFPSKIIPINATIQAYADYVSLSDLAVVYYDKRFIQMLERNTVFDLCAKIKPIPTPLYAGIALKLYS